MNLRKKTSETLDDVGDAARRTGEAAGWVGVALVAVTAVSLLALVVAVTALGRTSNHAPA
ncbi:MAG: hypothetical protein WC277_09025 [Bacilli bacterium]|jgi:hypothetical protein